MIGLVAWILGSAAVAGGWSAESPAYTDRGEANTAAKVTKGTEYRGKVVRRYAEGSGWEFVVRVDDLGTEDDAKAAAQALIDAGTGPVMVKNPDGDVVTTIAAGAEGVPAAAPTEGDGAPQPGPAEEPPAWVEAVMEAHGPGLDALSDAERVKIVYTRKLADGRIAQHTYARRGTDLYLSIEAKKGEIAESTTLALGDAAWLTAKGETTKQDLQRSRETIEKFGPTGVIPLVLDFEEAVDAHPLIAALEPAGDGEVQGEKVEIYRHEGGESLEVAVGARDRLVRRVALDAGKRVHEFGKYTTVEDVQIPMRILSRRDGVEGADQVAIDEVELDGELPDSWFQAPE